MVLDKRLAGILLHPTSLPGPFGIGDIGPAAHLLLDWMRDAGLAYLQVLPLGPTSFGDSPYQCFSALAGNPLLVSPELLVRDGLLDAADTKPPAFPAAQVDYGWVIQWKAALLRKAHARYAGGKSPALREEFDRFAAREDVARWLDDYALFMALKDAHDGRPWNTWAEDLRSRKAASLKKARHEHADNIAYHRFAQFLFFHQWAELRAAAHARGITVIGDAPIYVAYDSADAWANQDLFQIDKSGTPTHVAGVPPDYFSATGQLWGNPLYDWHKMEKDGYSWWAWRLRSIFALVDIVRLDHFRGFMGYWSVPFGSETAQTGTWVKGPGAAFFSAMRDQLGELPIIAEDLGEITEDVDRVREEFGLPGMRVMQFAWGVAPGEALVPDPNNPFLLHRHERNTVVYSGTHDNDTTLGWWRHSSAPRERICLQVYMATDGNAANWDLIRASFMSVGNTAIIPAQDFLDLDSEARMNFPGKAENNWSWRLAPGQLSAQLAQRIRGMTILYERCATPPPQGVPDPPKKPEY
jgi:4-alpha-glucanotransferase